MPVTLCGELNTLAGIFFSIPKDKTCSRKFFQAVNSGVDRENLFELSDAARPVPSGWKVDAALC